ncbi:fructose-bisphosphate aldolase C-A isoform X6 [Danio rerio]|uniref:Fructose-bisphosphate aldolase C-A isoform X6 n=1 Tax=Danio rerio TaxID=7955 RepID=A0AC58HBQ8_DANRE|nr:putative serine/threonine-protein kinase F31E3.2 isoform X2 [Danio rerio]|eukprot:XP_021322017.1 putative serine/threonine-protein kinase F31E3.2 isoform X2 [Danio rerio]
MGGDGSKNKASSSLVKRRSLSCHQGFLSVPAQLVHHGLFRRSGQCREYPVSEQSQPSDSNPEGPHANWTLPGFISIFLPEFPHRFTRQVDLQILGFIAKGSFGPILKVKDVSKEETYAVKVLPKAAVLRHGVLQQSKEEVIIQRQVRHPFLLSLRDCWQSQSNLFIMCDYCSTGDLYTYWTLKGLFEETDVRVFAAELGSALGFLHNFGIIHRDVKMENILLTDKAPEVLSGGPYSHAADWWSLGILLYALATGEFPLAAEVDHAVMLSRVSEGLYEMPVSLSPALAFLLIELLCKIPTRRLRCLEHFQSHKFFHGMSFDSQLLQRNPIEPILALKTHPDLRERSMRGLSLDLLQNFECDLLNSPSTPTDLSPTLMKIQVNEYKTESQTKATGTNSA